MLGEATCLPIRIRNALWLRTGTVPVSSIVASERVDFQGAARPESTRMFAEDRQCRHGHQLAHFIQHGPLFRRLSRSVVTGQRAVAE